MASKFELNSTIQAPPSGKVNVRWQTDIDGNVSAWVDPPGGGGSGSFVYDEIPAGTKDGSNKIFTLTNTPSPAGSLYLFLNGVEQGTAIDFALSGSTITYTIAPRSDDQMFADYTY